MRRHLRTPCATALLIALMGAFPAVAAPATASPPQADAHAVAPSHQAFEDLMRQSVTPELAKRLSGFKVLHLSGDVGPWLDTGLALLEGQPVTLLMSGRFWWSRAYRLWLDPAIAVWAQVGPEGQILRGSRDTHSFVAAQDGALRLKLFPGLGWTSPQGTYVGDPAPVNPDAGGGISVAVLAWVPGTAVQDSLRLMGEAAAPWVQAELARQATPERTPEGWSYMWELGPAEIFSRTPDGGLAVHTHADVGILQKDASFPLRPGTQLAWDWRLDQLPSAQPEGTVPTHDYLSIAVEFDNGRDLTFLWSHSLPQGQSFACPLPAWKDRETHVVQRSGDQGLGQWQHESLDLYAAYQQAIGGAMPGRVTRVWLIANSVFQKGVGRGEFAGIRLSHGEQVLAVH